MSRRHALKLTWIYQILFNELMYVEDAISIFFNEMLGRSSLNTAMLRDEWTRKFVESLYGSVMLGKPLSIEQSRVFLKTLQKYKSFFDSSVVKIIDAPYYRNEPYKSLIITNEVRYLGGNYLGFKYKRSDSIRADFKKISDRSRRLKNANDVQYHSLSRIWIVPVTRENFKDIMMIIGKHDFKYDDEVIEYLSIADNSTGQKSTFVVDPDTGNIIANVCDNAIISSWINNVLFGKIT